MFNISDDSNFPSPFVTWMQLMNTFLHTASFQLINGFSSMKWYNFSTKKQNYFLMNTQLNYEWVFFSFRLHNFCTFMHGPRIAIWFLMMKKCIPSKTFAGLSNWKISILNWVHVFVKNTFSTSYKLLNEALKSNKNHSKREIERLD